MDLPPEVRLFVAINLPDEVRANLARLRTSEDAIRWTPPGQIHLTLKFFGDVDSASLGDLESALCRACEGARPFNLEAAKVGAFPNLRRPRVLWAGLEGDLAPLAALQERVRRETEPWGRSEDKPFSPHLTVGRVREGRSPDLRDWAASGAARARFGSWQTGKIHLMRSVLSPGGATHTELAAIDLPGSD
jgi:RNA 2',3'-cyclic 3'-phosphodiesterase